LTTIVGKQPAVNIAADIKYLLIQGGIQHAPLMW
jgi:hypothetical protein